MKRLSQWSESVGRHFAAAVKGFEFSGDTRGSLQFVTSELFWIFFLLRESFALCPHSFIAGGREEEEEEEED